MFEPPVAAPKEDDVGGAWHQNRVEKKPQLFELPANLLLYTTDLAAPRGRRYDTGRTRNDADSSSTEGRP